MNVKEDIEQFLESEGWSLDADTFTKSIQTRAQSVMILNGQRVQQPPQSKIVKLEWFGEGSIDDTPLQEYNIYVENEFMGSVLVDSLEDFKKEIYIRFQ